jgi:hypothetical protein
MKSARALAKHQRLRIAISALLFCSLACRTATRLIIPDTPTPVPSSTPTLTPTPTPTFTPTLTPTNEYVASCPSTLSQIIDDSTSRDANAPDDEANPDADVTYLVRYTLTGDELEASVFNSIPKSPEAEQKERESYEEIWKYFTRLIPADEREVLNGFSIITDGKFNVLASVNQSRRDPNKWNLNVDIADSVEKTILTFTLLHEYGHLLTLNPDQVAVSLPVFKEPDDEDIYQSEVSACPQYFTGEGCSIPESYINIFFDRFWADLYAEWQVIDEEPDEETRLKLLDDFYDTYQDQFLTDYAPTSPAEDIAEAWAFFILSPRPELTSIADEKILFFYEFPELVELRMQISDRICVEFQG